MSLIEKITLKICLVFSTIISSGCVPHIAVYRYISLEHVNGAEIVGYGKAELKYLKSHSEMPVKYEFKRSDYNLIFDVDKKSYLPAMVVSASAEMLSPLSVEFKSDPSLTGCASYKRDQQNIGSLRFTWLGCNGVDDTEKQKISLRILDSDGNVISEEIIPFELKQNGTYVVQDAI